MSIQERRTRERGLRQQLIIATARELAENEGWDAVTTRRLAERIEYSQPVLYSHFAGKDEIVEAVAVEGFVELTGALRLARRSVDDPHESLGKVASAYADFANANPALFDAMFTRTTRLPFGADATPAPLIAAFGEIQAAVAPLAGDRDVETLTEVWWSMLHGLVTLGRDGRLRPDFADRRMALVTQLLG
ncbi:TetR/AcrR family transcriptional regulator [Antrihabitans cavernicola]|uniref:TetR/AcrR family transcriptional regulator n=1 Tax=Antrihabitans cavernicola TaxID=2495913 RepID=A0A5A7SJ30_9NOCA|nr:TetR/AcrR family transcriptional regulator [Spelaeibacter cavernicola]KAA0024623.1 TetR/AcrR family transcriptional regulator [Spelaeibacter cavernicola]